MSPRARAPEDLVEKRRMYVVTFVSSMNGDERTVLSAKTRRELQSVMKALLVAGVPPRSMEVTMEVSYSLSNEYLELVDPAKE